MKTKKDYINFWIDQANDDWTAVDTFIYSLQHQLK